MHQKEVQRPIKSREFWNNSKSAFLKYDVLNFKSERLKKDDRLLEHIKYYVLELKVLTSTFGVNVLKINKQSVGFVDE